MVEKDIEEKEDIQKLNTTDKADKELTEEINEQQAVKNIFHDKLNNLNNNDKKDFLKDKADILKEKFVSAYQNTSTFKEINKLSNEKKFFGFIIIVLAIVISVQGVLNYSLITANRTIVLPPAVTKEFWVTDKKLSESYFEQIGFYIADRVLSVSPETVDASYISLLPFFDSNSESLKAVREKLKSQADFVKAENMYQVFYPMKMYPYYNENKLVIEGPMKKFIGEILVQDKKLSKITIIYEIKTGRFMIKSLDFSYKD